MRTRRSTWERWGFLPQEAEEFRQVSRKGTGASYVQRMINHRRAIKRNAIKYDWPYERYVDYILDEYEKFTGNRTFGKDKLGFDNIWSYYRVWESMSYRRGEEYESPWRQKIRNPLTNKREVKRVTKKDMLLGRIQRLQNKRTRSMSDEARIRLDDEIFGYEQQLRRMENK